MGCLEKLRIFAQPQNGTRLGKTQRPTNKRKSPGLGSPQYGSVSCIIPHKHRTINLMNNSQSTQRSSRSSRYSRLVHIKQCLSEDHDYHLILHMESSAGGVIGVRSASVPFLLIRMISREEQRVSRVEP